MKIALCDDDPDFLAQSERCLKQVLESRRILGTIRLFNDAESLLAARASDEMFDLYLLDVFLPGITGIELARRIRETQAQTPILFFTTSADAALEAFSVGAAHYVVKPFEFSQFEEAVDRALAILPKVKAKSVVLKTAQGLETFLDAEVISAETFGHHLTISLRNGRQIVVRMTGQDFWKMLEPTEDFLRVGSSLVLNLADVRRIESGVAILANGKRFVLPRRSLADVRNAFLQYRCR